METDPDMRRKLRAEFDEEQKMYITLKNSRWYNLTNSKNLSNGRKTVLNVILEEHNALDVCYAMKEKMCRLFELRDPKKARNRWIAWFEAAKESDIDALLSFAELKKKRLEVLISHAT